MCNALPAMNPNAPRAARPLAPAQFAITFAPDNIARRFTAHGLNQAIDTGFIRLTSREELLAQPALSTQFIDARSQLWLS